jgi:hypothetical protein
LKAKKKDKPAVAATIVQIIREKNGRFLKRIDKVGSGQVLWIDIGDEKAKEKTCQALREGAPEIRRKRKSFSTNSDCSEKGESGNNEPSPLSNSDFSRLSRDYKDRQYSIHREYKSRQLIKPRARPNDDSPPIDSFIRPIPVMVAGSGGPQAIPIEQLDDGERDLYLIDFAPPDACYTSRTDHHAALTVDSHFQRLLSVDTMEGIDGSSVMHV